MANIEVTDELKEFFIEAFEMLEESENIFLQVGKGKDFKTIYSAVFRTFHSLKGAGGMFELMELQHHMHQLENILTECQPRNAFTQGEVTFFLKGIDAAKKIINGEHVKFDYTVTEENAAPKAAPAPAPAPVAKEEVRAPSHAPATAPIKITKPSAKPLEFQGEVVVVDDEEEIGFIIERFLQGTNFKVRRFTDPVAAIESIKEKHPDAVFTDMNMPVKSGMDVLKATKAANPDIPVVIVSAYLEKDVLIECIQSGAYCAIEKPFDETSILSTAMTAVRESRLTRLFQRSINLILYQFADLDDFLKSQGKGDISHSIKNELQLLIDNQKEYRKIKNRK